MANSIVPIIMRHFRGTSARTAAYPEDLWHQVIAINLTGVWRCMKYELDQMRKEEAVPL